LGRALHHQVIGAPGVYIIIVTVSYRYLLAELWNSQGLAARRRRHRAYRSAGALCDRLGAVRAEGNAAIQIDPCLAHLSLLTPSIP
jgi:hypothetical protein